MHRAIARAVGTVSRLVLASAIALAPLGHTGSARAAPPAGAPCTPVQAPPAFGGGSWIHGFTAGANDVTAAKVTSSADGGFLLAGNTRVPGTLIDAPFAVKTDAAGMLLWQKTYTYSATSVETFSSVDTTADGGFIFAGTSDQEGYAGVDAWIMKTDGSGGIVWQKSLHLGLENRGLVVRRAVGGGYWVLARVFSDTINAPWIVKLGGAGAVLAQATYDAPGAGDAFDLAATSDGGFVLTGRVPKSGTIDYDVWVMKAAADGAVEWSVAYGGTGAERGTSIQPVSGGYLVGAESNSFGTGDSDLWLLKLNAGGALTFQYVYATPAEDHNATLSPSGGSLWLAGTQEPLYSSLPFGGITDYGGSLALKVPGTGGNPTVQRRVRTTAAGQIENTASGPALAGITLFDGQYHSAYLARLDSGGGVTGGCQLLEDISVSASIPAVASHLPVVTTTPTLGAATNYTATARLGNVNAHAFCAYGARAYGGPASDAATGVVAIDSPHDRYIVAGRTQSFGATGDDGWLFAVDTGGSPLWQQRRGGADIDRFNAIAAGTNRTAVAAGQTRSFGAGQNDAWVTKIDASGATQWRRAIGNADANYAHTVARITDNDVVYIAAGSVFTPTGLLAQSEALAVGLNEAGGIVWQKRYGISSANEEYRSVVLGWHYSILFGYYAQAVAVGSYAPLLAGSIDALVGRFEVADGTELGRVSIGGPGSDSANDVYYTGNLPLIDSPPGSLVIAGLTNSYGAGATDGWVITKPYTGTAITSQRAYGGAGSDVFKAILRVEDGYVLIGHTNSWGAGGDDGWVVRIANNGQIAWQKTVGGTANDQFLAATVSPEGHIVLAGTTRSFGAGQEDAWIVALTLDGTLYSGCGLVADSAATVTTTTATATLHTPGAGNLTLASTTAAGDPVWTDVSMAVQCPTFVALPLLLR